jgi:hypothetical protein
MEAPGRNGEDCLWDVAIVIVTLDYYGVRSSATQKAGRGRSQVRRVSFRLILMSTPWYTVVFMMPPLRRRKGCLVNDRRGESYLVFRR